MLIDTGDEADRATLERSLEKLKPYGHADSVRNSIGTVLVTHAHPDHFDAIHRFDHFQPSGNAQRDTTWAIGSNARSFLEYVLALENNESNPYAKAAGTVNGEPNFARDNYKTHRQDGITANRFTLIDPTSPALELPDCITLSGYEGHEHGQLVTLIRGREIRIFYVEELESVDEHTKPHAVVPAVVFGGDVIVDRRYLARVNSVNPAEQRNAVYAINFETDPVQRRAQLLQGIEDARNLAYYARQEGAVILFGHGKHASPDDRGA